MESDVKPIQTVAEEKHCFSQRFLSRRPCLLDKNRVVSSATADFTPGIEERARKRLHVGHRKNANAMKGTGGLVDHRGQANMAFLEAHIVVMSKPFAVFGARGRLVHT